MDAEGTERCEIRPFPWFRRLIVDAGRADRTRHAVHGLIEADITRARELIASRERATGERISLTAFVVACVARAVAADRDVQAYRDLRGRLVLFDDVDVNLSIEVQLRGERFPLNHVIRAADERTVLDIHGEIRGVQRNPSRSPNARQAGVAARYARLPGPVRGLLLRSLHRLPHHQKRLLGTVGVTSVGMFGSGGGWGIAFLVHTLDIVVGGIARRPDIVDGRLESREFLDLTISVDHDVVDGAPAARFVARLRELLASASGLEDIESGPAGHPAVPLSRHAFRTPPAPA